MKTLYRMHRYAIAIIMELTVSADIGLCLSACVTQVIGCCYAIPRDTVYSLLAIPGTLGHGRCLQGLYIVPTHNQSAAAASGRGGRCAMDLSLNEIDFS